MRKTYTTTWRVIVRKSKLAKRESVCRNRHALISNLKCKCTFRDLTTIYIFPSSLHFFINISKPLYQTVFFEATFRDWPPVTS